MKRQRGSALLLLLLLLTVLGAYFALRSAQADQGERDQITSAALGQAKEALTGFAANYRYLVNANEVFGYMPCPDTDNDGSADPPCGVSQVSVLGRVPWRTPSVGLAPARDSAGQCLWYAVSGAAKDNPKTSPMNWDTPGQFIVQDADGVVLAGATPHDLAMAVLLAPQAALAGQTRAAPAGPVTECGGNLLANAYLEGSNVMPGAAALSTFTLSTPASRQAGLNNDLGTWIKSKDIFDKVKKRGDFKSDIDNLVGDLANCLNALAPSDPVLTASLNNKGVDNIVAGCPAIGPVKINVLAHWRNNLLYTQAGAASTVNGVAGCAGVLLFAGERTQRTVAPLGEQIRATPAQTGSATLFGDPAMYLEGANTIFPAAGAYAGPGYFNSAVASADVVRCVKGLPVGAVQRSFASDFASFVSAGVGVSTHLIDNTITLSDAGGATGGCFWSPSLIPLAGKTLRAYHDFKFSFADDFALSGIGADRGNGFTLQLVGADPGAPPNGCGNPTAMGSLGPADPWGSHSIVLETDVHRDAGNGDPVQNHSAILLDGHLDHTGPGNTLSLACGGSATACAFAPANRFEETPPIPHNQRLEIHSGCNATCEVCDQLPPAAPNDHTLVLAWVDCSDCSDVATNLDRVVHLPTVRRCIAPDAALNSVYFGFTGGFLSGASQQGVTLGKLILRSE